MGYTDDCGINYQAVDADPSVCICMTTKVEYLSKGNGNIKLSHTEQTSLDPKEIIIDLHVQQGTQAGNSCRFFKNQPKNISLYMR